MKDQKMIIVGTVDPVAVVGKLRHQSLACLAEWYVRLMTLPLGTVVVIIASSVAMAWEVLQRHNTVLSCRNPPDAWHDMGHAANSVFLLTPCHNPQVACAADDRRRAPAVT